jgi:hypothetical protein
MEGSAQLISEIAEAFQGRARPADDRLAFSQPGCPGYEGDQVARFFRGRDWRDLTAQPLIDDPELDRYTFMAFMTPEGFVYFLPAFLRLALDVDGPLEISETLAFKLKPPTSDGTTTNLEQHFAEIVGALSPAQRESVRHTLEFLAEAFDQRGYVINLARQALDDYWAHLGTTEREAKRQP